MEKEKVLERVKEIERAWGDEKIGAFSCIDFVDFTEHKEEIEAMLKDKGIKAKITYSPYMSIDFIRE